ncbi:MAG TPA: cupredoxin family copper-binding protein [Solirubrobacterales bacterium]
MKLKALLLPVLALLAAGLVACGGDDDSTSETEATTTVTEETSGGAATDGEPSAAGDLERSVKVEIVDFAYDPDPVQVATGGKVIWQNEDAAPHTATADDGSFDTGTLEEGKIKSESFKEAGAYTYFCEIHPTMKGTVEVVDQE